jgi:hypothetical protein
MDSKCKGAGRTSKHNRNAFSLTDGDVAILKEIQEYRFLRREHLALLIGRNPKRLHRRLLKLVHQRYLVAIRLPQQKHIYTVGPVGLSLLAERGIGKHGSGGHRLRVAELKELFLKHEMLIVEHHVLLTLATRGSTFRLIDWREGRELFDYVLVVDRQGFCKLPVRPDAFYTIEDTSREEGRNRFNFFLEIDRSTMPHTAFREKLRAYRHYREQGLHSKKLGIPSFRTITVTLSTARAQNLRDLARAMLPEGARKHFLFGALDSYTLQLPHAIFGEIYLSAREVGNDIRYPLIPHDRSLERTA